MGGDFLLKSGGFCTDTNGGFFRFGKREKKTEVVFRVFTPEELRAHSSYEFEKTAGGSLYMAAKGKVYDVTTGKDFYGPRAGYAFFSGRDASRGLAKSSLDPSTLDEAPAGDLSGLDEEELQVAIFINIDDICTKLMNFAF